MTMTTIREKFPKIEVWARLLKSFVGEFKQQEYVNELRF